MKYSFLLIFVIIALTIFGCKTSTESEVEVIKIMEKTRLKSLVDADMKIAKPLHADEFQLITPDGSEYSKKEYLGLLESGKLDYKIWNADSIRVKMYDNVAVLRYIDKDFIIFVNGKLAKSGILKHTNLYEKRNGQWQIIWSHASGGKEPDLTE
jgi:hypothetical protein